MFSPELTSKSSWHQHSAFSNKSSSKCKITDSNHLCFFINHCLVKCFHPYGRCFPKSLVSSPKELKIPTNIISETICIIFPKQIETHESL